MIQTMNFVVTGYGALLLNNPQTVDRFNRFAKSMSVINKKGTRRTDEDYLELRRLEVAAKIYFDKELGVYVPVSWITAAIEKISHKQAKISKAEMRGAVMPPPNLTKMKLTYRGMRKVKSAEDIISNGEFHHMMLLKQGQVKVAKMFPIFHDWSFSGSLDFDSTVIDPSTLKQLLEHAAHYGGFGDFRPNFGRAEITTELVS